MSVNVYPLRVVWPGLNHPVPWTSCLRGPDPGVLLTSVVLTCTLPALAIYSRSIPSSLLAVLVITFFSCLNLYLLLRAAFIEPGIVPRRHRPPGSSPQNVDPDVQVGNSRIALQWCYTCLHWRPLRARHCREIDCCVLEMDHYCPWISNCVGQRNYRQYVLLVWCSTGLDLYVSVVSGLRSIQVLISWPGDEAGPAIVAIAVFGIAVFLVFGLVPLAMYHAWLISQDITTSEHVKGIDMRALSGEDSSCWSNWFHMFCDPIPKSLINLDAIADSNGCLMPEHAVIQPAPAVPNEAEKEPLEDNADVVVQIAIPPGS